LLVAGPIPGEGSFTVEIAVLAAAGPRNVLLRNRPRVVGETPVLVREIAPLLRP
jgi:hypothetical protein